MRPDQLLDTLSDEEARKTLLRCCGSGRWAAGMLARRPFGSPAALRSAAHAAFGALGRDDWLAAFGEHPAIGADLALSRAKFAETSELSRAEQAGAASASDATLHELAELNASYKERFGYTFIVCATGRTAPEMLETLKGRLENDARTELFTAAHEQEKITLLRLEKLAR
jgi:OHCU decarboxylase